MRKQVLVTVDRGETRVAILEEENATPSQGSENGSQKGSQGGSRGRRRGRRSGADRDGPRGDARVAELYVERLGGRSLVGNIYKGKVDNVLAGLEAAFVDIGLEKNGFLHVDDIVMPGVEVARRGRGGEKGQRISQLLKPGHEVVVQVSKDPLKSKGARLTMQLSIAGRYLVYVPQGEGVGVSRRLEDKERDRLRKQASKLDLGGGGAIIRTAARGAKREDFDREIHYLFKLHEILQRRVEEAVAPAMVFQEADLSVRVVRDIFSGELERAVVDDDKQFRRLTSFFTRTAPELVGRVEHYQEGAAAVRALRRRGGHPVDAQPPRRPALGRLPDDRLRRGHDRDRRELRVVHRTRQGRPPRGHDHEDQPRGRRRDRPPAPAPRHRRDHRHRLHRHVAGAQPRCRAEDAAEGARRGPHQDVRDGDLAARARSR